MTLYRCETCGESFTDLEPGPLTDMLERAGVAWCFTCQATQLIVPAADFTAAPSDG